MSTEAAAETSVLVVGPAWVGDMVMAQSLFMALHNQPSVAAIDVLAPAWTRPLLARMPEVRAAIDLPLRHGELGLAVRLRVGRALRGRYRRAILLPNSLKSALLPFWARIPVRTGYLGEHRYGLLNDVRRLDRSLLPMTVQRFVALAPDSDPMVAPEIPRPCLRVDRGATEALRRRLGLEDAGRPVLALCPGAEYGPAKRWPPEYFVELANHRIKEGWQVWIFGSGNDRGPAARIAAQLGPACHDLCGRTSLGDAVDLLSQTQAVVSNDSGLMHVAAALQRPLVALFGSSDPQFTPPLGERVRVLSLGLECSPCFQRECPLGHTRCLRDLLPEQVDSALQQLLQ